MIQIKSNSKLIKEVIIMYPQTLDQNDFITHC